MDIYPHFLQRKNPSDLSFKVLIAYYNNINQKSYNWVFPIETDNLRFGRKCSEQHRQATSKGRKGIKFSQTHIRNLSLSHIGKKLPEEQKKKISDAGYRLWKEPEFVRKLMKGLKAKPTKPEVFLMAFLERNFPSDWKYVGDRQFIIAGKNPDFINVDGKKQIIEFNGFYTHTKEEEIVRTNLFLEYGFKTLFLHYEDLTDENRLRQQITQFTIGSGEQS